MPFPGRFPKPRTLQVEPSTCDVDHISRQTLYEDRRRAWRTLAPVIPGVVLRAYHGSVAPRQARRPGGAPQTAAAGGER
jgi:hypothetical protein